MESQQKQILFVFVSLIGGFLLFAMRLKSPQVHHSIKPNPSPGLLADSAERVEMRKQAIRALFTSRNTLSFCKNASTTKSKGDNKYIKSRYIPRCRHILLNMSSVSKIINKYLYRNIFLFY